MKYLLTIKTVCEVFIKFATLLLILLSISIRLSAQQSLVINTKDDCLVLDNYVDIITDLTPNELYKVTVTANDVFAPMQGLFFMYQDANEGIKFRYVDDGESFNFVPIAATRKIAPIYVDWSTTADNSGTLTIDFQGPTTKTVTIDAKNDALLLDNFTTIVTDLVPNKPYTVNVIDDNINAPMQGLFFMFQNSDYSVGYKYINAGDAFVFSPVSVSKKIAPLYVDWSTASDNSGNVIVEYKENLSTGGNQLTVTSPNGGESWQIGSTQSITWIDNISENVKIELLKNGTFHSVLFSSIPSDGSKSWAIPSGITPASDYKIVITSVIDANICDTSDFVFAILGESYSLPFNDDFTGGPKPEWQVIGPHWDFADDKVYSNVDPAYQYEYMIVGDNTWTDYTFEVDLMGTSGTDKSIAFRVQDTGNFYFLHFIGPIQYHHLVLQKYVNGSPGTPYYLYEDPNYPVQNNVNYHVKVEAYGNSIKVYVNGSLEIDIVDDTYGSGGIALLGGWNGYAPCYVQFDNVSVYQQQSSGDLVAYYPFNGNANDESGNGNDGNVLGPLLTEDRIGNPNSAYLFDGSNDYINCGNNEILDITGSLTMSAWFKMYSLPSELGNDEVIVGKWRFDQDKNSYVLNIDYQTTNKFQLVRSDCPTSEVIYAGEAAKNRWYHYAGVIDQEQGLMKIYVNGELVTAETYSGQPSCSTDENLLIGKINDHGGSNYFHGVIDEVRIYNYPLSNEQIQDLYGGYNEGLVAYYPFNGNYLDESGNDLHLTAIGSPTLAPDRFGNNDRAYYFDGLNDFFIHNYDPLLTPTNEITVNVWVKHFEIDGRRANIVSPSDVVVSTLDLPDVGGYQIDITLYQGQEVISWDIRPLGGGLDINIPYEPQWKGNWTMLTGTFNQEVSKLFVNGEVKDSLPTNTTINYEPTNDFRIGTNPHADNELRRYKGFIDDVRIYDRALMDAEVLALFDITTGGDLITVTLPNGGESWAAGSFYQIKWNDEIPDNESVKIDLLKGGVFLSEITPSTPADGSKDWYIPSSLPVGNDYKIKITKADDPNIYDFSNANFTISEFVPQIVLTEPNGGEDWYSGHSHLITWIDNIPENVKIELFKGGIFHSLIISSTYSDGSKDWDIPPDLHSDSDYRIKISSVNNSNVYGISDADFTITGGLPVELVSFEATSSLDRVSLSWQTATETNSYGFDIERRMEDNEWSAIGFVEGSGNSNSLKEYSFIDTNPIGGSKFFYRLKQIDIDGKYEYTNMVEVVIQPNQYTLYQNYPNPFNPSTTIKFSLPEDVRVRINVYNSLGELVADVINKDFEAGYHKITFGSTNIPSGIYFYRIIAGEFIETKKMILMK